jgi:hypothetical protein
MQLMRTFSRMTTLLALASVLLFSIDALAAAATVTNLNGTVSARKADGSMRLLSQQSEVDAGESITTEKNSFARLKFSDGGEITLRPETTIAIDSYRFEADKPEQDNLFFTMVKGGLRTITGLVGKRGNRDAYRNKTAIATIGIRVRCCATVIAGSCQTGNTSMSSRARSMWSIRRATWMSKSASSPMSRMPIPRRSCCLATPAYRSSTKTTPSAMAWALSIPG